MNRRQLIDHHIAKAKGERLAMALAALWLTFEILKYAINTTTPTP
jgi:hypothetical protein